MSRYRCPECHSSDHLWETVTVEGWQGLDAELKPTSEHDIDGWHTAERGCTMGCSNCVWEGSRSDLQVLGTDGKPLPNVLDGQLALEE